jgi:hypothetical protein
MDNDEADDDLMTVDELLTEAHESGALGLIKVEIVQIDDGYLVGIAAGSKEISALLPLTPVTIIR